jgi:hypothetical protein
MEEANKTCSLGSKSMLITILIMFFLCSSVTGNQKKSLIISPDKKLREVTYKEIHRNCPTKESAAQQCGKPHD